MVSRSKSYFMCWWPLRQPRARASAPDAAKAEILDLEIVLDAVFRALAAEAGFLDAAERRHLGRDDAFVDADDAVFQPLGNPEHAADVARVEIGRQAEFGVVGHADRIVLGLEAEDRRDRAERLLARHRHLGIDVGQDGRLVERAAERVALAAHYDLGPLLDRVLDVLLDLLDRLEVDQRADCHPHLDTVADLELAD